MAKRLRFDSANKSGSINSSEESDEAYSENQYEEGSDPDVEIRKYQSRRKPKCFSRNAQMARENRLKKKIHLAKLEKKVEILKKEKNDLSGIIDAQSIMLTELKKEVRYLKGVLANSSDICTLIRNIHQSTKMPVSLSMKSSLKVCTNSTDRGEYKDPLVKEDSVLPEYHFDQYYNPVDNSDNLFDIDNDLYTYLNTSEESRLQNPQPISPSLEEHDYTSKLLENQDYGICLHVCKNKLSLEFCSSCEENARSSSSN